MAKKEIQVKSYRTKEGKRVKQFRRKQKIAAGVGGALAIGGLIAVVKNKKAISTVVSTPAPQTKSIVKRVKLKTKNPRRITTLENTREWADVVDAQKNLPTRIKVEHLNLKKNSRLPKNRRYEMPVVEKGLFAKNENVYSHGTSLDSLKGIKKSGVIKRSYKGNDNAANGAMHGDGVYLADDSAHKNLYGDAVFEFPQKNLLGEGLKRHNIGIYTVDSDLSISKANKLLIKDFEGPYNWRGKKVRPKNVKIRYKKALTNLINFMAESKVKSHSRRTKSGQVRVKEGRRKNKSLGKKIAIVGGAGVGLVGLGLVGKKLNKTIQVRKAIKDFKPQSDGAVRGQTTGTINGTPFMTSEEGRPNTKVYQTAMSIDALNSAKRKIKSTPSIDTYVVPDTVKATVEQVESNVKKARNAQKVLNRRKLLNQVKAVDDGSVWPIKPLQEASYVNKNRKQRKQAGKRLAEAAKDLRQRGEYIYGAKELRAQRQKGREKHARTKDAFKNYKPLND